MDAIVAAAGYASTTEGQINITNETGGEERMVVQRMDKIRTVRRCAEIARPQTRSM